jgi:putative phosphoribosyl transferase
MTASSSHRLGGRPARPERVPALRGCRVSTPAPRGRRFRDRDDAGRRLAAAVGPALVGAPRGGIVVGLPRGGVLVAAGVAAALGLALDAMTVRKVGSPHNPELAVGAVTAGGTVLLNDGVVRAEELAPDAVARLVDAARERATADERRYRGDRPPVDLTDREVVLVDDGAATGATVRACVAAARAAGAYRVVVALPVAPRETLEVLAREADAVVCLQSPLLFRAVGWAYDTFGDADTDEVVALLGHERDDGG